MSKYEQFNELTADEHEILANLLEKLGEAQQAINKMLCHCYRSRNPHEPDGNTNRQNLCPELDDVIWAIEG